MEIERRLTNEKVDGNTDSNNDLTQCFVIAAPGGNSKQATARP